MSNLSKLKLGKFVATIVALSSISAILSTAEQAEAFPAPTILSPGSSVRSNNQCFSLNAQSDGNLVIYRQSNGQALWNTATYGRNVKQTIFQNDGNLVIYNTSNQPVWASNTDRRGAARITLQDDGNFVMYNAQNQALWSTNTVASCNAPIPTPPVSSQPDFNASEYRNNNIFWNAGYAPGSTNPPNPKLGNALGNCTWYASGRAKQFGRNSARVDRMGGNASQWGSQASAAGIVISSQPQVGAIAQWDANVSTPYGHVAVVEQVNSNGTVLISESSYGSGDWNFLYRTRIVSSNSPSRYILP